MRHKVVPVGSHREAWPAGVRRFRTGEEPSSALSSVRALPALEPLALPDKMDHALGCLLPAAVVRVHRHLGPRGLICQVFGAYGPPHTSQRPVVEALVQPDEGVDEKDPEEELHPHVGKHAEEVVVGTDVDLVV